jgi:hypothetical protein
VYGIVAAASSRSVPENVRDARHRSLTSSRRHTERGLSSLRGPRGEAGAERSDLVLPELALRSQ